ncbi:MAG: MATE family efflux transporter [Pseudomonadota bacterium]
MKAVETPALPAVRFDANGNRHVDYRAILALAGPLFLNTALQAVLNLTDTWFIGRLSVDALAAMGAIYYLMLVFILLLGGVGLGVQTLSAQYYGAGRYAEAARSVWSGVYAVLLMTPLFVVVALNGDAILAPFKLAPAIEKLSLQYWFPRLLGGVFGIAFWAISGFFNGIGRTKVTLAVSVGIVVMNAVLNEILMFRLHMGMAGSAWATTFSLIGGATATAWLFLRPTMQEKFQSRLGWRFDPKEVGRLFLLGLPMGLAASVDLLGFALFQLMQVRLGPVDGAATQIVMMLTSTSYYPALGLSLAATTLVGQSIGAGDKDWAMRVGNATIMLTACYTGMVGAVLAMTAPWLASLFVTVGDPNTAAVVKLGTTLLWIASAYQVFDGLSMASSFSLRGAGDVKMPALALLILSWFGFVPLAHMLSFAPGQGWVDFLPKLGLGAAGGWTAALIYIVSLSLLLFWRWRSGAWRQMSVI